MNGTTIPANRSYGNENWEFDELGYMKRRFASINDLPIREADRKFCWERRVEIWIRDVPGHGQ
jgi:nuclear transport factor 2 (NTF2) superfamily protein